MSQTPDTMVSVMELIEETIGRVILRESERKKTGEKNNVEVNDDKNLVKKEITNPEKCDKIDVQLKAMTVSECGRMNFNWQKVNTILEGQLI